MSQRDLTSASDSSGPSTAEPGERRLRLWVLGDFRFQVGTTRPIRRFDRHSRSATIFKLLALAPGHCLHSKAIVEQLWPELELRAGLNNLRGAMFRLRHLLEPDRTPRHASAFLTLDADGVSLHAADGLNIDFKEFMAASDRVIASFDSESCDVALQLYGGELLPNDSDAIWAAPGRSAAREQYVRLLLMRAQEHEARGEYWAAARRLDQVIGCEPAQEQAHQGLMQLYELLGLRHLARRQFHALRSILQRDLTAQSDLEPPRLLDTSVQVPAPDRSSSSSSSSEPRGDPGRHMLPQLSQREREVLMLLAEGYSDRAIANLLSVSTRTAEVHVSHVFRKLGAHSRDEAIACVAAD
jgi:DNA-binding SARP family transcriptional activator/DNA-binding CsgD family transcriptional regulator